jgi:probable F420-dependent oxidoreductase
VIEITVSVQAEPADLRSWLALARRLESAGFHALVMGDHPGAGASPWPALGSAAAVTSTLRLGTYVVQAGVREPMHVAADAATLNILAPGRVLLGIGAGHAPREWRDIGRYRPAPGERAGRLAEFVDAVARLLDGETVTCQGRHLGLRGSRLEGLPTAAGSAGPVSPVGPGGPVGSPMRPVGPAGRIGLVVGGGHPEVLRAAARRADVVGLSGLGRTLSDGHRHEVRWSDADLRRQLDLVRDEASRAGNTPVIEALVQVVTVTQDRAASIEEISGRIPGASAQDVARTPFLLIGTYAQMAAQLRVQAEEFGITSYVVREPAVPHIERVLPLLSA